MRTLMSLAVVLTLGSLATLTGTTAQTDDPRVAVVSLVHSPLQITPIRAVGTTATRVAEVMWEATSVTSRPIREYLVRVYVYRATGRAVGLRSTREPLPINPGTAVGAHVSLAGGLEVAPSDILVIAITKVLFEDDSQWDAPADVTDRVKAEVARIRGVAAAQPHSISPALQ